MIKCLIVDDEPHGQQILSRHIENTNGLELIAVCANASQAYSQLQNTAVDLIFLDIQMPAINGIDFIRSLHNPPSVIFTTAYSEYGATAFDLAAVDYLLKPISLERFQTAIAKYTKQQPPVAAPKSYSYFKVNGRLQKIEHKNLLYAKSIKDYLILVTADKNYVTHMTMKYLEELLPGNNFRRVHRSFLVNLHRISAISAHKINIDDTEIPVGENYRPLIRSLISTTPDF